MSLSDTEGSKSMTRLVEIAVDMYSDACGLEAVATWDRDEDLQERADVAWSRYEGARTLLSMVFGVPESVVDEDMELLMTQRTFG